MEQKLEETVERGYEEERSLEDVERRAKAAAVTYSTLDMSEEGREILGEQFSPEEIQKLTTQLDTYDKEISYRAAQTLITKLQKNMEQRTAAWVPKNPESAYTLLERLVTGILTKVSTSAAARYTARLNKRIATERQKSIPRMVTEQKKYYEAELERLTEEYTALRKQVTDTTAKLIETEEELTKFENARNTAIERIASIQQEYAAAQQVGNIDNMRLLTERENNLLRDITTYEGAIDSLSAKIAQCDQQISDYIVETGTIKAQKQLIGFLLHEFYSANREVQHMAGGEERQTIDYTVVQRDLTLLKTIREMAQRGAKTNEDLKEIVQQLPLTYTPHRSMSGATPEDIVDFQKGHHQELTKVCNSAHETARKYREVYTPKPV